MRAFATWLAGALLIACAAGGALPSARPPAYLPAIFAVAYRPPQAPVRVVIPVPVMPQAVHSRKALGPAMTIGSPYLHMRTETYEVPTTPAQIYGYYAPLLRRLGYRLNGSGEVCGPMIACSPSWDFQRGALSTFVLNVQPMGEKNRFSLTMEQIVVPPRPGLSYLPQGVERLQIRLQPHGGSAWRSADATSPAALSQLRRLVNSLPVKPWSTHGCLPGGGNAVLFFTAGGGIYTYYDSGMCDFVEAPTGIQLWDPTGRLWQAIVRTVGEHGLEGT